ncbi:MAG: SMP-30/gluconolactonase/LRE family protein [Pseudomonadota bacterium]
MTAMPGTGPATRLDAPPCRLGEGPLWHPERGQLFWFDILAGRLHAGPRRTDPGQTDPAQTDPGAEPGHWDFPGTVSAAGWIDRDRLLLASDTALLAFDIETGRTEPVAPLEADNPATRSNDGRADPWGGFWIGTMGRAAEPGAGAIYRYYRGEIRRLHAPVTIPNAIAFTPDGGAASFADTARGLVWRQRLAPADGWPAAEPEPFIDAAADGLAPDGAVFDRAGRFWNAQWGAGRLACYAPDGRLLGAVRLPASQTTCPAFGGPTLSRLFVTSAHEGLDRAAEPAAGALFALETEAIGQPEHRIGL